MRRCLIPGLAILLLLAGMAAAQSDALLERLTPAGHVNDFAGVMAAEAPAVEALLVELRQKTGAEVAVVALTSLEGGDPADFANRLFERWGIGRAEEDGGVLLLAAIADRQVRIEVGYGLEPLITDARAGRILDESVLPHFRQGRYGPGLAAGADAIAGIIAANAGVELTGVGAAPPPGAGAPGAWETFFGLAVLLLAFLVMARHPWLAALLLSSRGRGGGFGRGGFGGGGFGRGGGFGGFGGGRSGGGGAGRSW